MRSLRGIGEESVFFHAEAADYAEIFGTVFVVVLFFYVLGSLRSLREIGKGSVLFHAEAAEISVLFALSLD